MARPSTDTPVSDALRPLRSVTSSALGHGGRDLPNNLRTQLGARIGALRQPYGLSQRDAAQLLGISQAALSKIEQGKSVPSLATLLRLQAVFDLDSLEVVLGVLPSRAFLGGSEWGRA